jgi:hypothetical protein
MKIKVDWDLESDGKRLSMKAAGVKRIVEIPDDIAEDEISDYITDQTGWCLNSWEYYPNDKKRS